MDWITYIVRTPADSAQLTQTAEELAQLHAEPTNKRLNFNLGGYTGWRIGAVRLGYRGHSSMLQLSGEAAASSWEVLRPFGGLPSRLDVQVSWQPSKPLPRFGQSFIKPAGKGKVTAASSLPRHGESTASDGLYLGTVGRRTSERYLRVYDKGVELGTLAPGTLWRMEVEAKGQLAARLWADLLQAQEYRQWCYDSCAEQWKRSGYTWPLGASSRNGGGVTVPTKVRPEPERLAEWLRVSVAPAVARMGTVFSREQILDMLGLTDPEG